MTKNEAYKYLKTKHPCICSIRSKGNRYVVSHLKSLYSEQEIEKAGLDFEKVMNGYVCDCDGDCVCGKASRKPLEECEECNRKFDTLDLNNGVCPECDHDKQLQEGDQDYQND